MQGVFNLRPQCPKYSTTCNVDVVIICNLWVLQNFLSLKALSLKLVVLMALMSASTSSDLHTLDLNFHRYTPGMIFTLPTLTKTRRSGPPPKESFYCKFKEILCPVHTLKIYEKRTECMFEDKIQQWKSSISFQKPHTSLYVYHLLLAGWKQC